MSAILVVGVVGTLLWATPFGQGLERQFGLRLAFLLRGERPVPDEVVYVRIDQATADVLLESARETCRALARGRDSIDAPEGRVWIAGVPVEDADVYCRELRKRRYPVDDLKSWARPYFATLVARLSAAGASVIAFDVAFLGSGGDADTDLADAFRRADNIVLLSDVVQLRSRDLGDVQIDEQALLEPAAAFTAAARAIAPMPLPRDTHQGRFPAFVWLAGHTLPTLPVVAAYLHGSAEFDAAARRCPPLVGRLRERQPAQRLAALHDWLRSAVGGASPTAAAATGCDAVLATPIGRALSRRGDRFFNFYGDAGSFASWRLHEFVTSDTPGATPALKGKAVFVGLDDRANRNAEDSFLTPFGDGYFSGVELAATGLANLLSDDAVMAIDPRLGGLLIIGFSFVLGLVTLLPARAAVPAIVVCIVGYGAVSGHWFDQRNTLVPIVVPLVVQTALVITVALVWRLVEFERVSEAVLHFLPRRIKRRVRRRRQVDTSAERLFGVCMHTDVADYTRLSEKLAADPLRLKALEREYWALIDAEIAREGGERLEISGDGMLSVWTAPSAGSNTAARARTDAATRACRAALAIHRVVDAFNASHPETPFRTRIGLHAGDVALGLIGGSDQYTLAVGGDVANTAARIENDLNKQLGTRLLVSDAVVIEDPMMRRVELGTFTPRGKTQAVTVFGLETVLCEHGGAAR